MEQFRKFVREELNVKEVKDPIIDNRSESDILNDLMREKYIDLNKEYKEPPMYLGVINEHTPDIRPVCTPKNLSAITGKAKSKKTFLQTLFVAASASNSIIQRRIKSNLPEGKNAVLVFDTEQSEYHVYRVTERVSRLTGGHTEGLGVFSLRGLSAEEIIKLIEHCILFFKNVGMVYIDQVADLARSINDEKEAVKIVKWLEKLSQDNDLHICCVIHQNKGDNFASGWLGSQIMKKAETVISVDKDSVTSDISHIKPAYSRSMEFEEFSIRITDKGLPEILDSETLERLNTEMKL